MLYQPDGFEPLTDDPWDADRVRGGIREIVSDTGRAFDPDEFWPADEWDAWQTPLPLKNLYAGAAGVIWALDALRRRGHGDSPLDLAAAARRTLDAWRETPDFIGGWLPPQDRASLCFGESGILAVAWRLAPSADLADDLLLLVRENVHHDANELMSGAAGTMLAAGAMLASTGEERWADAWRESADELWRRRDADGLWTQRLYGNESRGIGAAHGAVGNVRALLQGGGDLLEPERRETLERETADLLARSAVVEDRLANWPPAYGESLVPRDGRIRLQWCHGAPGVIVSAASCLHEELLLAGAELTWRAGPAGPDKGAGICHGTAGNGHALLKTFERTGDELWLERARRFAVHALGQVDRARAARGRGRYSLWTGDLGVALYAADCLDGRGAYPIVDFWGN